MGCAHKHVNAFGVAACAASQSALALRYAARRGVEQRSSASEAKRATGGDGRADERTSGWWSVEKSGQGGMMQRVGVIRNWTSTRQPAPSAPHGRLQPFIQLYKIILLDTESALLPV